MASTSAASAALKNGGGASSAFVLAAWARCADLATSAQVQ
jgi:hypothetical protein